MSFEMRSISCDEDDFLVAICGLCDGNKNICWRCLECNVKMCKTCKIIHSNAKGYKNHRILSFNDVDCYVLDAQIKKRIQKLPCRKHPYQNYNLYCKTCEYLVCYVCVPNHHILHDISGIDHFIDEKLKTDGAEVTDNLPKRFLARSPSGHDYSLASANFEVIHNIVTKIPVVYYLKASSYLSAWVGCLEVDNIQHIKMPIKSRKFCIRYLYNKMNKAIECNHLDQIDGYKATDIEIMDDDILFVSDGLKRAFTDAYGQKQVFNIDSFDPLVPICLHIQKSTNFLWIGLKEKGKDKLTAMSIRRVIAISKTWQTEKSFEFTMAGRRLFTLPFRIADIVGQICIIDRTSQTAGRVISLNSHGHRMWEYFDPQGTNADVKPFFPTAIATTARNIIIIDAANSGLHMLDTAGNVLIFQCMSEFGIDRPFSLDVDPNGRLWVGTACDKFSEDQRAMIWVINMSIQQPW